MHATHSEISNMAKQPCGLSLLTKYGEPERPPACHLQQPVPFALNILEKQRTAEPLLFPPFPRVFQWLSPLLHALTHSLFRRTAGQGIIPALTEMYMRCYAMYLLERAHTPVASQRHCITSHYTIYATPHHTAMPHTAMPPY